MTLLRTEIFSVENFEFDVNLLMGLPARKEFEISTKILTCEKRTISTYLLRRKYYTRSRDDALLE